MLTGADAEVRVRLRDAAGAVTTRVVPVRAGRNPSRLAAVQWARLTLASLEGEARTNKVRIRELGKRFGLATRETSLIVLEQVEDYVRNEIEPPAELRAAYDRIAASASQRRVDSDAARLAQVVRRFEARAAWWNRDFPKGEMPVPLQIAKSEAAPGVAGADHGAGRIEPAPAPRRARVFDGPRDAAKDSARSVARNAMPAAAPPAGFAARPTPMASSAPRRSAAAKPHRRRRSRSRSPRPRTRARR